MGPRRKLQMAIKEMKEQLKVNESTGSSMGRSHDITPTPQKTVEKDLQIQVMQLKSTNQQVWNTLCLYTCNLNVIVHLLIFCCLAFMVNILFKLYAMSFRPAF